VHDPSEQPVVSPPPQFSGLRTGSWILYDLANTVYAATLTFVFTPYVAGELNGREALGYTQTVSMVLAGLLVPILGALSDHTARTRRYLTIATLICIAAMIGWAFDFGFAWIIGCFFVANLAYNTSLLFYNSLLPYVADEAHVGRVSGLGVGVGYFGTIAVLAVIMQLGLPASGTFAVAGLLFLVTALPCLLLVRDPRPPRLGSARGAMAASIKTLRRTLRELPRHRALLWFLLGNFCLIDVLNTAVLFFADFTTSVFQGMADSGDLSLLGMKFTGEGAMASFLLVVGLTLNALALVFGIGLGRLTDRAPLRVMRLGAFGFFIALFGGAWFGGNSALGYLLTLVTMGAFGLSAIQTAGRKIVLVLAPKDRVGEFFGLYGITTKLSVFGSSIYGFLATRSDVKTAMLAQSVQLLLGVLFLAMVRLPKTPPSKA
jgi:MFS transporter, UMF1 family